ncbi:MAG: cytochrome c2 [Sulfurimonas sp.]|jgi:cytochrome c2
MNKIFLLLLAVLLFNLSPLSAAIYKGQKVFVKKCSECHESGQSFVASKKMREWKKLMKKKGEPLAKIHFKSDKAKDSWKYFKSNTYAKKSKHLKQFLVEYAKDSGNVPACN